MCKKLFVFLSLLTPIFAMSAPSSLGINGYWEAGKDSANGTCMVVSYPLTSEGNYTKRDSAFFIITISPKENPSVELAYFAGYPYGSQDVIIKIDGNDYTFKPSGEWAWPSSPEKDIPILNAMKRGQKMEIHGISKRGTKTYDTFSLSGISASLDLANNSCN